MAGEEAEVKLVPCRRMNERAEEEEEELEEEAPSGKGRR